MEHVEQVRRNLRPEIWERAGRRLLEKMISEFIYEEILHPEMMEERGEGTFFCRLSLPGGIGYRFEARKRLFDTWRVVPGSVVRTEGEASSPATDPLRFLLDIREAAGLSPETAAHLLNEYSRTLLADAHILARKEGRALDPEKVGYAELEGEMEGHPWITFNKGRIGFGYDDYLLHAPEMQRPLRLPWLAVSRESSRFVAVSGLDHEALLEAELGEEALRELRERLDDPEAYHLLPVHPWQWKNVVVPLFAGELASGRIVPLGEGPDLYLPQQSIRTFFNTTDPQKLTVKLPLSILNTLVWRGLPGERTEVAPRVTEWVRGLRDGDPFLREECRVILPGEVAGLNYDHPYHAELPGTPYQHLEMLGAIWRESVFRHTAPGERPVTLAALLHVDGAGQPFFSSLLERSGLGAEEWLERFFGAVLPPLLHYLYRYGTVFSPHGENTILVLDEDFVPSRLAMKDFVDDVNVSEHPLPELESMPGELRPVLLREPPEGLCQFIWSGLFICHLRYLSEIAEDHHGIPERRFWGLAREEILRYQRRFPELGERFRLFDLLAPSFTRLCLNRNRLLDYGYADDGERPHASAHGRVTNALHEAGVPAGR
ncbi:iron transporter [Rubrobacter xylanophilus]|uniref:Iron transporter n=1 Tax=Rubrobacter xylanophilus TaxID=49319 RepID=A0A510HPY6_9ACTN|nr:IucA/IucC family siderophore biosynthesis protein [Rubrobacter xylanophilus]BBL80947.1 iron transporter [Rubrobacter xylanophilus]